MRILLADGTYIKILHVTLRLVNGYVLTIRTTRGNSIEFSSPNAIGHLYKETAMIHSAVEQVTYKRRQ